MSLDDRQIPDGIVARQASVHLLLSCDPSALDDCLAISSHKDIIVLVDTAVTWLAQDGLLHTMAKEATIYCLEADIAAHGLAALADSLGVSQITDGRLVELICQHQHCLSWK